MSTGSGSAPAILTIGHSTLSLEEFIGLLTAHGVAVVVDIRTVPRSRHNPQFNKETLPDALKAAGIGYVHMAELGGLRHPRKDSPNTAWRNSSFRGFADYMQTPEFDLGVQSVITLARKNRIALMCAEAVPWRCHRSLIADKLLVKGIHAEHIMSPTNRRSHVLTPWARVAGTHITYPQEV